MVLVTPYRMVGQSKTVATGTCNRTWNTIKSCAHSSQIWGRSCSMWCGGLNSKQPVPPRLLWSGDSAKRCACETGISTWNHFTCKEDGAPPTPEALPRWNPTKSTDRRKLECWVSPTFAWFKPFRLLLGGGGAESYGISYKTTDHGDGYGKKSKRRVTSPWPRLLVY
jgi:hypothetical protein